MGIPLPYSDLLLPKFLLHLLFLFAFLRRLISSAFFAAGLGDLIDSPSPESPNPTPLSSPMRMLEILPVVRLDQLLSGEEERRQLLVANECAVCLYELELADEVRRLDNCRHVFHRRCIDRWVDHGRRTCPLCRAALADR